MENAELLQELVDSDYAEFERGFIVRTGERRWGKTWLAAQWAANKAAEGGHVLILTQYTAPVREELFKIFQGIEGVKIDGSGSTARVYLDGRQAITVRATDSNDPGDWLRGQTKLTHLVIDGAVNDNVYLSLLSTLPRQMLWVDETVSATMGSAIAVSLVQCDDVFLDIYGR